MDIAHLARDLYHFLEMEYFSSSTASKATPQNCSIVIPSRDNDIISLSAGKMRYLMGFEINSHFELDFFVNATGLSAESKSRFEEEFRKEHKQIPREQQDRHWINLDEYVFDEGDTFFQGQNYKGIITRSRIMAQILAQPKELFEHCLAYIIKPAHKARMEFPI